jgi:hypothetical protein
MEKFVEFLKKYWWIWLALMIASIIVLIIGPSVVGNFMVKVFQFILTIAVFALIWNYTFGKGQMKAWGVFRLVGLLGIFLSTVTFYIVPLDQGRKNLREAMNTDPDFLKLSYWSIIAFLVIVAIGEILLYLENIQEQIKNNSITRYRIKCIEDKLTDLDNKAGEIIEKMD